LWNCPGSIDLSIGASLEVYTLAKLIGGNILFILPGSSLVSGTGELDGIARLTEISPGGIQIARMGAGRVIIYC